MYTGNVIVGMEGWMDDLRFYVFSTVFQSYQDDGNDNERLCAMERRLRLR